MKKSFIIIYSVFVSLVLIFSITFFAVNVYNEKAHGELRTQVRFGKITTGVTNAIKKTNLINSETIRQIENTIGDTKDFAYLKISENSKTIYLFPEDYDAQNVNDSKLIIPYNSKFTASDNRQIEITAGMYSLRPSVIYNNAKTSFFIILIVSLLTFILIIYNNHFDSDKNLTGTKIKSSKYKKLKFDDDSEDFVDEEDDEYKDDADYYDEEKADDSEDFEEAVDESDKNDEIQSAEEDVSSSKEKFSSIVEVTEAPAPASVPSEPAELPIKELEPVEIVPENNEKGLFSPDTGFGWESYLLTRLENELNRATASELDLALFIIKLDGIGRKNPIMKKICEYLTVEFQFKDLLFEYKDDSICGIKISMNIDNAITFAEKLVDDIKKMAADEAPVILSGVTTRGIRMVTGERLLKEADEAVKHAAEDVKCPVVGFRADAIKYRKFIETK
ncbi:MAG: GGDEF domain-containing protein [Treponema sp.]|nr:GGDEF domain-containing protein [Treponema sp.]